jgi:Protein of unknown function (DUF2752)
MVEKMFHELMPSPKKLNAVEQRQRLLYLGFVVSPLGVSWINSWGIHFSLWGCPLIQWIGVPCMGWGLTRSFYATARGDLAAAAHFHLFGPLLFLGLIIAALHWTVELMYGRPLRYLQSSVLSTFYTAALSRQRIWLWSFLLILGYHFTRLITLYQSGQLQSWVQSSIASHWF